MARKSTIGSNPLDNLIPPRGAKRAPAPRGRSSKMVAAKKKEQERERLTVQLPTALIETLRNIAYWDRIPLAALVEDSIKATIARSERSRGDKYPQRDKELRAGRPLK